MSTPTPTPIVVSQGFCLIYTGTDASGAFDLVGETRDGVMLTPEGYWIEVKGDENGGEAGPPIEIQYVGETARLRCEMTKFDPFMAKLLERRLNPSVAYPVGIMATDAAAGTLVGAVPPAGSLMFAGGFTMKVCLCFQGIAGFPSGTAGGQVAASYRTYPRAIPRHAIEINKGTKYSTFVVEFECHKSANGNLFYEGTGNTPA
jgi:hypothetical protein